MNTNLFRVLFLEPLQLLLCLFVVRLLNLKLRLQLGYANRLSMVRVKEIETSYRFCSGKARVGTQPARAIFLHFQR